MGQWLQFVKLCAKHYHLSPEFVLAVAQVESGKPGELGLRFGPIGNGTYYGPFGLHKCFLKRWPIGNPYINAWIGIKAIAHWRDKTGSLMGAMKKYNASFNQAYWQAIKACERRNQREGVFE